MPRPTGRIMVAQNRKARHDYHLHDRFEAGMVLTGGSSLMAGIRPLASRVLNMPVRIAKPENLLGLVDQLQSPVTRLALLEQHHH